MLPQIILLSLVLIGLLITANLHGKERPNYNFWLSLISNVITLAILYWGGFFDGWL